jgi:hypothetical protein
MRLSRHEWRTELVVQHRRLFGSELSCERLAAASATASGRAE